MYTYKFYIYIYLYIILFNKKLYVCVGKSQRNFVVNINKTKIFLIKDLFAVCK